MMEVVDENGEDSALLDERGVPPLWLRKALVFFGFGEGEDGRRRFDRADRVKGARDEARGVGVSSSLMISYEEEEEEF